MKWLLIVSSFLIFSCASVKEIEKHSEQNVASIEALFRGGSAPKTGIIVRETIRYPLLKGSSWIRAWRGSYYENGAVVPEGWIYLRLEEEKPATNF